MNPIARIFLCASLAIVGTSCRCSRNFSFQSGGSNVTSYSDTNWNGNRTVTQRVNGMKRTLEMKDHVRFEDGKITQLSPGDVVKLSETKDKQTIEAELREHEGKPELWVKAGGTFRKGNEADHTWLDAFLKAMSTQDRGANEAPKASGDEKLEAQNPDSIEKIAELPFSSDRAKALSEVARKPDLTSAQQVSLVNAAFKDLSFDSEKESVLLLLIAHPQFSSEAKTAIIEKIDRIGFDSSKVKVLKALAAK